jgi:hypothetical protein
MNRILARTAVIAVVSFFAALVFVGPGCKKDTECKAVITVLTQSTGQPVAGIKVELTCPPNALNCGVDDIQNTDASGKSHHSFKLPAILDIKIGTPAVSTGKVIRLEAGETAEQTVYY